MPNGMYGGVRGEKKSPLLDFELLLHFFWLFSKMGFDMQYFWCVI